jgi:hypothetical protein
MQSREGAKHAKKATFSNLQIFKFTFPAAVVQRSHAKPRMQKFTLISLCPFVHSWLCCIHKSVRLRTAGIRGIEKICGAAKQQTYVFLFPDFLSTYFCAKS